MINKFVSSGMSLPDTQKSTLKNEHRGMEYLCKFAVLYVFFIVSVNHVKYKAVPINHFHNTLFKMRDL